MVYMQPLNPADRKSAFNFALVSGILAGGVSTLARFVMRLFRDSTHR